MSMQVIWGYAVLLLPMAIAIALVFILRLREHGATTAEQQSEWLEPGSLIRLNRNGLECIHPVPLEALTGCLSLRNPRM